MNSCVFKGGDFFMPDFIALINKYVRSELLVLLPVLYILGKFLIAEKLNPNKVNIILLIISVLLSGLYLIYFLRLVYQIGNEFYLQYSHPLSKVYC